MWKKSEFSFQNKYGQTFDFYFQNVGDSNWRYKDKTYNKIFVIKISSSLGGKLFTIFFDDDKFNSLEACEKFLLESNIPYNYFIPYLAEDVKNGINWDIIKIHEDDIGFIILPRPVGKNWNVNL